MRQNDTAPAGARVPKALADTAPLFRLKVIKALWQAIYGFQ